MGLSATLANTVSTLRRFPPEHRVNSQFVHLVNQDHEIMGEYLTAVSEIICTVKRSFSRRR